MPPLPPRWDVFCRVVDNYGDAGVCWRLARQLAVEHRLDVTLWQNDLSPLARMVPGVDAKAATQHAGEVTIRRWDEAFVVDTQPADVVIEAFGCGLPDRYVQAMAQCSPAPRWFVLEYLSAETWVDGSHGLPSPHPRLPLLRRFWFPGFSATTGGLLRERGLLAARDAFQRDAVARGAFWARLGVPPGDPDEQRISMFCYPAAPLASLLDAWAEGAARVTCLIPEGVASGALDAWAGGRIPERGEPLVRGRLTVRSIPFLPLDDYDRLLWACDVNFVRGEDSFVRAQWAARPLVWQIYPQDDGAHWLKLDAFLDRYIASVAPETVAATRRFWHAWNGDATVDPDAAWIAFAKAGRELSAHGRRWASRLADHADLASTLVKNSGNGL
jgi:uncharacterized repeat protein (TIGR03837 family)